MTLRRPTPAAAVAVAGVLTFGLGLTAGAVMARPAPAAATAQAVRGSAALLLDDRADLPGPPRGTRPVAPATEAQQPAGAPVAAAAPTGVRAPGPARADRQSGRSAPVVPALPPAPAPARTAAPVHPPASPAPAAPAAGAPGASLSPAQYAARILAAVNQQRRARGLAALAADGCAGRYAQAQAERMAAARSIGHQDLNPVLDSCGGSRAAENVAVSPDSPEAVVDAWMASPSHRANILDPQLTSVGTGAALGGDGRWYVCQDFRG